MVRIGTDRIGLQPPPPGKGQATEGTPRRQGFCPVDGARGEFVRTALVCPRCHRLLGGC